VDYEELLSGAYRKHVIFAKANPSSLLIITPAPEGTKNIWVF